MTYDYKEVLLHMEYRGMLNLIVSDKLISIPVVITHKELDVDAEITIKALYLEKEYLGKGKSLDWADAFADLQRTLPHNVKIQCCMTCKYGTLCPYGNLPNYVLCSQAVMINSKDDVIDWLAEMTEVKEIEKSACGYCEKFEFSNENDYTYNDYFYYLKH